jgi:opacity protein-like surface antigen
MKNFNSLLLAAGLVLLLTSCVSARAGGAFGSLTDKFNSESYKQNNQKNALASNTSSETGFYVGVFFNEIPITDDLELELGISYVSIKDLDLIHFPVLVKYNFDEKFSASAGPSLSYFLDQPDGLKSLGFGLNAGLSYEFVEDFSLEVKYDLGLSNLIDNAPSGNSLKFSQFMVGVAYQFKN